VPLKTSHLHTKRPPSFLFKPLKIDGWGLFSHLYKAIVDLPTMQWKDALEQAIEAIQCVKFEDDPGGLAWSLVYRAMMRALPDLAKEGRLSEGWSPANPKPDLNRLDAELLADRVSIDEAFFQHPGWSPYCLEVRRSVPAWLTALGLSQGDADRAAWHLPRLFTTALSKEWLKNKDHLDALKSENFRTPFTPAEEEELAWAAYAAWLDDQADRRLFEEDFGLMRVHIPLRAYVEVSEGVGRVKRTIGRTSRGGRRPGGGQVLPGTALGSQTVRALARRSAVAGPVRPPTQPFTGPREASRSSDCRVF
jgi:hypothetical protein